MGKRLKLDELTDFNKLKKMGQDFAGTASKSVVKSIDKVKSSVIELTNQKVPPSKNLHGVKAERMQHMIDSLNGITEAQKKQIESINALRKDVISWQSELERDEAAHPKKKAIAKSSSKNSPKKKEK